MLSKSKNSATMGMFVRLRGCNPQFADGSRQKCKHWVGSEQHHFALLGNLTFYKIINISIGKTNVAGVRWVLHVILKA